MPDTWYILVVSPTPKPNSQFAPENSGVGVDENMIFHRRLYRPIFKGRYRWVFVSGGCCVFHLGKLKHPAAFEDLAPLQVGKLM